MNRTKKLELEIRKLYESKKPGRADWCDWLYENHVFLVAMTHPGPRPQVSLRSSYISNNFCSPLWSCL